MFNYQRYKITKDSSSVDYHDAHLIISIKYAWQFIVKLSSQMIQDREHTHTRLHIHDEDNFSSHNTKTTIILLGWTIYPLLQFIFNVLPYIS